jgi:multiple antibiotic resistance protein
VVGEFIKAAALLLVILNPFALSVYLLDLFRERTLAECSRIVFRAVAISGAVFALFASSGEAIFSRSMNVSFPAFQIFGGALFFVIALRFMLVGSRTLVTLRGEPGHVAGAVAFPFMIGPGSVSAATMAGVRLGPLQGTLAVVASLVATAVALVGLKLLFDVVNRKNAALLERYVEIASRVSAMLIGTIAVEMILQGLSAWRAAAG